MPTQTPGCIAIVTPSDTNYITAPVYNVSNTEAPLVCTAVDLATDTLTRNTHGLNNGDEVVVPDAGTTNLSTTALYYVRDSAANTFKLAASIGGAAVDITGYKACYGFYLYWWRWQYCRAS
jgi:hypothetical protein